MLMGWSSCTIILTQYFNLIVSCPSVFSDLIFCGGIQGGSYTIMFKSCRLDVEQFVLVPVF